MSLVIAVLCVPWQRAEQMSVFVLQSVHGSTRLEISGKVAPDSEGWFRVTARLVGDRLQATVEVSDTQPESWARFFRALAEQNPAQASESEIRSLEGHLSLSCRSNRTGHTEVVVELRDPGTAWRAVDTIHLESGSLPGIAGQAEAFYGESRAANQE